MPSTFRVPRSSRCEACRDRKIKCDQRWPTCGRCERLGKACSGPPAAFSHFIINQQVPHWSFPQTPANSPDEGVQSASPSSRGTDDNETQLNLQSEHVTHEEANPRPRPAPPTCMTLVQVQQRSASVGGGVFSRLKVKSQAQNKSCPTGRASRARRPARLSTSLVVVASTTADLSAQRLVKIIQAAGDSPNGDYGASLRLGWLHLLPVRFASSPALCDAADLFISSSISAFRQRTSPPDSNSPMTAPVVLDAATYARAARSLRLALSHGKVARSTETLAAVALLHVAEQEFAEDGRLATAANGHASGLQVLMEARGPPNTRDELEMRIHFEALARLLARFVLLGQPQDFHEPRWIGYMDSALRAGTIPDRAERLQYSLCIYIARWPDLAARLQAGVSTSRAERDVTWARELAAIAGQMAQSLVAFEEDNILPLLLDPRKVWPWPARRDIQSDDALDATATTTTNAAATIPGGLSLSSAYTFDDWDTCQILSLHVTVSLAVNQILLSALLLCTSTDESTVPTAVSIVRDRLRHLSERIWRSIPYAQMQVSARKMVMIAPLILSMEYANPTERETLGWRIMSMMGRRSIGIFEREGAQLLLAICRALTGRGSDCAV